MVIAGTPVGDNGFVMNYVTSETGRVMVLIDPAHNFSSLIYLAHIVDPLHGVREAFAEVDRTLRRVEEHLFGLDPHEQYTSPCISPGLACLRAELPVRFKSIGLPWIADVWQKRWRCPALV